MIFTIYDNCKDSFAFNFPFWQHLSKQEQDGFCENISQVYFEKGEHIHSGNDKCLGVLFVKKGHIRVYMLSDEGREITLFRLFDGETCVFSASCVLSDITFDVFIDAEDDTQALLLKSSYFNKLLQDNIYVQNYTYKLTVQRFSDVMWAMQQVLFTSFDKRLAIFLLDELESSSTDEVKLTHEQIAKYMGSAREVVSRMLKYFENDGIVKIYRGGVKIIDKEKLRQQAQ